MLLMLNLMIVMVVLVEMMTWLVVNQSLCLMFLENEIHYLLLWMFVMIQVELMLMIGIHCFSSVIDYMPLWNKTV